MSKKTIEHAAKVLKEIKEELYEGFIKDSQILKMCNSETGRETLFAIVLTLSTKYDYSSTILEKWRKRLHAEDYLISVSRNQMRITFNLMY